MADESDKSKLSHAERIFVRISVMQTVLAVVGIFTGSIALYAGLTEADASRKQEEAAVWPHVELGVNRWTKEAVARKALSDGVHLEGPLIQFTLVNSGIGPAEIAGARVAVDGAAEQNWKAVFKKLLGRDDFSFGSSTMAGRVIRSGETVDLVTLIGAPAQLLEDQLLKADGGTTRVDAEVCYCSVFNKCWIARYDPKTPYSQPRSVKKCPDYGDETFLD